MLLKCECESRRELIEQETNLLDPPGVSSEREMIGQAALKAESLKAARNISRFSDSRGEKSVKVRIYLFYIIIMLFCLMCVIWWLFVAPVSSSELFRRKVQ